ncbi:MAG TPA: hypothetical protein EYH19_00585 [Desulfocapsa sulfexigens]|nr:hypothetical protein [Desulfocapsa sulfexigens]
MSFWLLPFFCLNQTNICNCWKLYGFKKNLGNPETLFNTIYMHENSIKLTILLFRRLIFHPMRYSVFTISPEQISWKTPMVSVGEVKHLEARETLLNATWWRDEQYNQPIPGNDTAVLGLYENNTMIIGARSLKKESLGNG